MHANSKIYKTRQRKLLINSAVINRKILIQWCFYAMWVKMIFEMKKELFYKTTLKSMLAEEEIAEFLNNYFSERKLKDHALLTKKDLLDFYMIVEVKEDYKLIEKEISGL